MFALPLLLSAVFAPVILAQNQNIPLQIQGIEAQFNNSGIVPSLLATFDPTAVLNVSFTGTGPIEPGHPFTAWDRTPFISSSPQHGSVLKHSIV